MSRKNHLVSCLVVLTGLCLLSPLHADDLPQPPAPQPACGPERGLVRLGPMTFCVAQVVGAAVLEPEPDVIRYRILVEKGLEDEADVFIKTVDAILGAEDGWARSGMRFERVLEKEDLSVVLARPWSVDKLCHPLKTGGTLSCAVMGRANINVERWRKGARTWGDDVAGYRHYLINHEVGHLLGLPHMGCKEKGAPAPIMLPQTKYLGNCTANGDITQHDLDMLKRVKPYLDKRLKAKRARQHRASKL